MVAWKWAAIAAGAAGVGGLVWWMRRRSEISLDELLAVTGPETTAAPTGADVSGDPATLARLAGLPLDVYALSRLIASEAGGEPDIIQLAVAWATRTESERRGKSIAKYLLGTAGKFGEQGSGGRPASTARTPTARHQALADDVVNERRPDPSDGATLYDSPQAQRALLLKRPDIYKKTPEQVAANRIAAGYEQVNLPGVSPDRFRMWRHA